MKTIAFIYPGTLPVPPVKGGAVENLVFNLIKENEKRSGLNFISYGIDDDKINRQELDEFVNTKFVNIYIPIYVKFADRLVYAVAKKIKKRNIHSFNAICQRLYYFHSVAKCISKESSIDCIIMENHPTIFFTMKWYGNFARYKGKIVYHAHNEVKFFWGLKQYFLATNLVLAVSEYIANTIMDKGLQTSNVSVLRNVVDTKKFAIALDVESKKYWLAKFNLNENDRVVLFVGRLIPEKGVKEAIEAFLKADLPNGKFMIVGDVFFDKAIENAYQRTIRKLVSLNKDKVFCTGYMDYDDMPYIYQLADIVLVPSLWEEPALLTGIEACSAGIPVITTVSGGIPEYVSKDSGFVLKRDVQLVDNIAQKLKKLWNDDSLRLNMGKNGKLRYEGLGINTYYDDFKKQITRLLK